MQTIDFSDSPKLKDFHPNAFGKPAPLELAYLNLKNCNLSTMAEGTLATVYWGTMHTLKLNGNPWVIHKQENQGILKIHTELRLLPEMVGHQ